MNEMKERPRPTAVDLAASPDPQELIDALQRDDLDVRRTSERRLAELGAAAIPPLIEALRRERNREVLWYLARALARIGEPAVKPLMDVLSAERDVTVRRYAAASLATIGRVAVPPLVGALTSPDREVRRFASTALITMGEPAVEPIIEMIKESDPEVQRILELILMRIDDAGQRALESLYSMDFSRRQEERRGG
ncbi:MAG: HEAT repeat domain-containing protein [Methanomicrobiales archaeon]|nr:HEAT repeat domain-containing protein [Methanomicrobiales archaeon]